MNVNQPDSTGKTPVVVAALQGQDKVVKLIMAHPKVDASATLYSAA